MELVPSTFRPLVDTVEACEHIARLLNEDRPLSRPRLYRFLKAGMPSRQPVPGGPRYYDLDAVAEWLKCRCNATTARRGAA